MNTTTRRLWHESASYQGFSVGLNALAAVCFTIAAARDNNGLFAVAATCFWISTSSSAYRLGRQASV